MPRSVAARCKVHKSVQRFDEARGDPTDTLFLRVRLEDVPAASNPGS